MKKIHAFTLMEIILCLTIIGILAGIMISNLKKTQGQATERADKVKVIRTLDTVQQASEAIKLMDSACPLKSFIVNAAGTYEYALTTDDVFSLYQKYIKFQSTTTNFCSLTNNCSTSNIKGGKIQGNVWIGFQKTAIGDCPSYYLPEAGTISGKGKCWGKLYIKFSELHNNDVKNTDYFEFGLNEGGVLY